MLVSEFCQKRGIPKNIERMFESFVRGSYADALMMKDERDTVKLLAKNVPEEKLEKFYQEFVMAIRASLPETMVEKKETMDGNKYDRSVFVRSPV